MALVLNTKTGNFPPQYHVFFGDTLSTVEYMSKVTVPGNWKKLIEEHSELATKGKMILQNIGILTNPQACSYTQVGLERRLTVTRYPRSTSRV